MVMATTNSGMLRRTGRHLPLRPSQRAFMFVGPHSSPPKQWTWSLDPVGNWAAYKEDNDGDGDPNDVGDLNQSRTHNKANELLSITGLATPLHDPAGNNAFGPRPADPNTSAGTHWRYDAWNRLSTVHLDNGDNSGSLDPNDSLLATYRYNGLNRRVKGVMNLFRWFVRPPVVR